MFAGLPASSLLLVVPWLLSVTGTSSPAPASDKGYHALFEDSLDEFDNPSYRLHLNGSGTIPAYMRGSFVQVGPARWCWGNRCMTHGLDGYSKLHMYSFKPDGTVGFKAQFLQSGFLAQSRKANDIVFNVMAQPCDPPLKMGMSTFMNAANDNNNVNVFRLGDELEVLSDTPTVVDLDDTLNTTHEYNTMGCHTGDKAWGGDIPCDKLTGDSTPIAQMAVGGSAHPFRMPNGDYIGLMEAGKVMSKLPGNERMVVYRRSASSPDKVQEIVKITVKQSSYSHSFGLARGAEGEDDHAIVIDQPLHYNLMGLMRTGTLETGLEIAKDQNTVFHVAPLKAGAQSVTVEGPRFFFGHVVNTFSRGNGVFVIDVNAQEGIFFNRYNMSVQRNKTARDEWPTQPNQGEIPGYMTVTRYEIDTQTKTVTHKPLFGSAPQYNIKNEHDLFKLHPDDLGQPYCGYWAFQSYFNSTSFASQAIIRTELCGKEPVVAAAWHRPNVYPGEATFVPKPNSSDKTEGTLVFKALDGNTGQSLLVVCDAKTMETITEAVLPVHVPFTVHGDWFAS